MRDPKRIEKILERLKTVWKKNPDLRLGQLFLNYYYPHCDDLYHVEDEELIEDIEKGYNVSR